MCGNREKSDICNLEECPLQNLTILHSHLRFLVFRIVRNKFLLFINHLAYDTLLWKSKLTKTGTLSVTLKKQGKQRFYT